MINIDRLCLGCMNDNGGEKICSICGCDSEIENSSDKLPVSFHLSERYIIGKVISECGEAVTYIAWDNASDNPVYVKEYFPLGIAVRNPDKTVSIDSGSEFLFNEGLMEFIELNRKLADSDLPSVFDVYNVFEENGTAYCIMATIQGITLEDFLERNGGSLRWEQARALFLPLIDTINGLHELGIYHCGISPESIMVGRDGKLRITEICGKTLRHSGIMANVDGYAAAEQYGFENLSIGSYTDVYGLSAVLFRVLIGNPPPSAEERINTDTLTIPAKFADVLPRQVLVALANGLQVMPQSRSSSVEIFRNELVYGETKENVRKAVATKRAEENAIAEKNKKAKKQNKSSSAKYAIISALCTALIFLIAAGVLCLTVFKDQFFGGSSELTISDDSFIAPSVPSLGDVDSDATESVILYQVPDLSGKYYSQIINNEEYERFEVVVKDKEYSVKYPKGTICSQTVSAGTNVEKDTKIEVVISLGTPEVKVANVLGLDKNSALIELLKQGFLYENIEIVDMYDSESKPGIVLEQTPEYGTTVNTETVVRICVNSFEGEVAGTDNSSLSR